MQTEWITTIVGAVGTLGGLAFGFYQSRVAHKLALLNNDLEQGMARLNSDLELEREERKSLLSRKQNAEDVLTRYREPLAGAAMDLQSRCYNIVNLGFLSEHFGREHERFPDAVNTTLFRFAQYFGWTEILRREIQYLSFPEEEATRRVASLQSRITRRLATSTHDEPLMIWADEQRAIGERMIVREDDTSRCMGYARFCDDYEACFAALFARVRPDLGDPVAEARLRDVQRLLCELVEALDPKHLRYSKEDLGLA